MENLNTRLAGMIFGIFAFGFVALISMPSQAADIVEKDIKVESHEAGRAETTASQDFNKELKAVDHESAQTEALGEVVRAEDRSSVAQEAKGDFSTGFKSVGRGFKNGTKATGRGFVKAGDTMGRGFKKAGTTMGKGFKKAGVSIKNFFTGKKGSSEVQERDLMAESNTAYEVNQDLENAEGSQPAANDDLELDFDNKEKGDSNDWT